jgi:hypothetical protein
VMVTVLLMMEGTARETRPLLQERHATGRSRTCATSQQATTSRGEGVGDMSPQKREGRMEQLIKTNLRATLTIKLPRRSGGSMIHVATADGGSIRRVERRHSHSHAHFTMRPVGADPRLEVTRVLRHSKSSRPTFRLTVAIEQAATREALIYVVFINNQNLTSRPKP